jgi:hypothetical protein
MNRCPPLLHKWINRIAMAAAIDSLRHPRVSAIALITGGVKRASKDANMQELVRILRGPRKSAGTSG